MPKVSEVQAENQDFGSTLRGRAVGPLIHSWSLSIELPYRRLNVIGMCSVHHRLSINALPSKRMRLHMQRATVEHLGDAFREQVGRENFSLAAFDPPHGLALAGGLCVGLVGAEEGDGSGVTAELDTRERLYRLGSAGGIFIWGILRWPSGKTLAWARGSSETFVFF